MSSADLLYSDTEDAVRDSVRHLFADRLPPELVTRAYDPAPQDFSDVWRTLSAELGMAGLLVPESLGGAGASAREAAVVMEEIGRAVAPVPFLSSAVLATVALLAAGDTETVTALAEGAATAALVVPLSTAPNDPIAGVNLGADGLTGAVSSVAGAGEADVLVVPVAGPDGLEIHTVSRTAPGVQVSPLLALDMTRPLAAVHFSSASSSRVGPGDAAIAEALQTGAALLASEQFGVAQWCFETTLS
ncbi:MAG TPA: acyl-CoA dehydrogenase family protein, partial [Mycobacterium sp.]